MPIQIFGVPLSVSVRRSLIAFKELQVPYDLVNVDITKEGYKTDTLLKNQPFGQIPYIHDSDNDLNLFESRAIARYIILKYDKENKSGLLPRDIVGTAKFEQAASFELTKFEPFAASLSSELVFKPVLFKKETDQEEVKKAFVGLNSTLDVYEQILSQQKYLAGDHVTLADLFHLSLGTLLTEFAKVDVMTTDKRPHVQKWWKDISSRPTWLEIKANLYPLA
ncbi:hypothetical protein EIP91_003684 [Steccherinum ochraceum]|uniref:glutathione transferase n=1 Tax=Steccherinum ochraceum TaxID=92696 RepID=A0A4R0RLN0_9APHY|nr:hypothetical protein EIP91_003684 [Steccherinum ochraceum]